MGEWRDRIDPGVEGDSAVAAGKDLRFVTPLGAGGGSVPLRALSGCCAHGEMSVHLGEPASESSRALAGRLGGRGFGSSSRPRCRTIDLHSAGPPLQDPRPAPRSEGPARLTTFYLLENAPPAASSRRWRTSHRGAPSCGGYQPARRAVRFRPRTSLGEVRAASGEPRCRAKRRRLDAAGASTSKNMREHHGVLEQRARGGTGVLERRRARPRNQSPRSSASLLRVNLRERPSAHAFGSSRAHLARPAGTSRQ